MSRNLPTSCLAACLLLSLACWTQAQVSGPSEGLGVGWDLEGETTVNISYYEVNGDDASSPFRFTGWQPYGQLILNYQKRWSRDRFWGAEILALVNDSRYRSGDDGFVPERLRVVLQDATVSTPYLAEFGDSYTYFSQRTVQRTLKGVQFELQSPLGSPDRWQSLQAMAGMYSTNWVDLDFDRDFSSGVSWLLEDPRAGSWSANLLYNRGRSEFVEDVLEEDARLRTQWLVGFAGYVPFRLGQEFMSLEGEFGHMRQSIEDEPETGSDQGYFLQFAGHGGERPLNYRVRYERYGEFYRPVGAPIIPDRRVVEGHLGWTLENGGQLRGRLLFYRDYLESADPEDANTYGVRYSGPVAGGVGTNLDVFYATVTSRQDTIDTSGLTFDADFYKSFGEWNPRLRLYWQRLNDRLPEDLDGRTFELTFRVGRSLLFSGLSGSIEPGVVYRNIDDDSIDSSGSEWYPTLALNLSRGRHSFVQDLGYQWQNRDRFDVEDVGTFSYRALYRYLLDRHAFSFEFDTVARSPDPGADTDSYRFTLAWTYRFDKFSPIGAALPAMQVLEREQRLDITSLVPGSPMPEVLALIDKADLGKPERLGGKLTWRRPVFEELFQRQELVLIEEEGKLARAAVLVYPEETRDPRRFTEEFERVRQNMMARYGRPDNTFDEGSLGPDVAASLNRNQYIRLMSWRQDVGTLRFGVPRRLDGRVVLELQIARQFPQVRETLWSIEDARR